MSGTDATPRGAIGDTARGVGDRPRQTGGSSRRRVTAADRAAINPFTSLSNLLQAPLASFYLVLVAGGTLLALGLLMVLSASSVESYQNSGNAFSDFNRQLLWALLGVPALVLALRIRVRTLRRWSLVILLVSIALLLLITLVPSLGVAHNGSVRWIEIGPLQFQPSEPAKLGLALWGADLLAKKRQLIRQWRHLIIPLFPVAMVLLALVGQHDLGTMLCLLLILGTLLWVAGVRGRAFAVVGAVGLAAIGALIAVEPYRVTRFASFMHPFADAQATGLQAVQGYYSLAGGGWFGLGLGAGHGKWNWLPEAQNDFIFAVIGEELGVLGCVLVLVLFCVLGYAGLRVASRVKDPFVKLAAASCTVWIVGQAAINIAAVTGLVPITGIPLPLISAGGSSLVLTIFVVGVLASFARLEPQAAQSLRRRGHPRWHRWLRMQPSSEPAASVPAVPAPRRAAGRAPSLRLVPGSGTGNRARSPAGGHRPRPCGAAPAHRGRRPAPYRETGARRQPGRAPVTRR